MTDQASASAADLRTRLAALLRQGHGDERGFGVRISREKRERTGTVDAWAPKEYIGHNAFWREREAERALALGRGEQGPVFDDFQSLNTESFTDLAAHSWDEAIEWSRQSTEALIAAVESLPNAVLFGPARPPTVTGTVSLLEMVVNNGYAHPQQHLAELIAAHVSFEAGIAARFQALNAIEALDAGPAVMANARYNTACALASTIAHVEAIELLRRAFTESPRLIALARQDTDLDPLRDDPAFQAMVAEERG